MVARDDRTKDVAETRISRDGLSINYSVISVPADLHFVRFTFPGRGEKYSSMKWVGPLLLLIALADIIRRITIISPESTMMRGLRRMRYTR